MGYVRETAVVVILGVEKAAEIQWHIYTCKMTCRDWKHKLWLNQDLTFLDLDLWRSMISNNLFMIFHLSNYISILIIVNLAVGSYLYQKGNHDIGTSLQRLSSSSPAIIRHYCRNGISLDREMDQSRP
jgi:hypothetical protein